MSFQTVNFCIPALKTKIQLAQNWNFRLFHEYRNCKVLQMLDLVGKGVSPYSMYGKANKSDDVTLAAGTVLSVARIYIRQGPGFSDFDSVTFTCKKKEGKTSDNKPFSGRFWAKLQDVNKIICFPIGDVNLQGFFNLTNVMSEPDKDRFDVL